MSSRNCEEYKSTMMGLMDDELTEEEAVRVNDHLIRCESCREEYEQLKQTSGKMEGMDLKEPDGDIVNKAWKSPYSRLTRNFGIILVVAGWLAMVIYGAYEFLVIKDVESIPKFAFVIMGAGIIVLFITVLRDRIKSYRNDPYKEVDK